MDQPDELYPFKFFDTIRGRWVDARYKATLAHIKDRYAQYEITGKPEVRAHTLGQFVPPGPRRA